MGAARAATVVAAFPTVVAVSASMRVAEDATVAVWTVVVVSTVPAEAAAAQAKGGAGASLCVAAGLRHTRASSVPQTVAVSAKMPP